MTKLRKLLDDMKTYLGVDRKGQDKLKAIKDQTGVLRRRLREAEEERDAAIDLRRAALEGARIAEEERSRMESEITPLKAKLSSAESRVVLMTKEIRQREAAKAAAENGEEDKEWSPDDRYFHIARRLRKRGRLPRSLGVVNLKQNQNRYKSKVNGLDPFVHLVDDFVSPQISDDDLWNLGASVYLLVAMEGTVVFHGDIDIAEEVKHCKIRYWGEATRWLRDNMKPTVNKTKAVNGRMYSSDSY